MDTVSTRGPTIDASCRLRRVGRVGFPVEELVGEDGFVARLGRDGSLRMFFGPGRRVQLADGTEWRIKAATSGRHIVPIITSGSGMIAISGPLPGKRSYGISGKDYGCNLVPLGRGGFRRPRRWAMRRHETEIATIDDAERAIHPVEPIPLSAAVMAFTLITHGIPGETALMPSRD
jgi:hypothetical protein